MKTYPDNIRRCIGKDIAVVCFAVDIQTNYFEAARGGSAGVVIAGAKESKRHLCHCV
jgi:hypothetical protein